MHNLKLAFQLMSIAGVWMPVNWTEKSKKISWIFISLIGIGLMWLIFATTIINLLISKNYAEMCSNMFLVPTDVVTWHKTCLILANRKKIIELGNMFLANCCTARNFVEEAILKRYEDRLRFSLTLACFILVDVTMLNLISLPILTQTYVNHTLPLKVWLPYSVESNRSYWITYIYQSIGTLLVGAFATGSTLVICGFMFMVCAQYEILSLRFREMAQVVGRLRMLEKPETMILDYERMCVSQNVQHHIHIFRTAAAINETFKSAIFQHFVLSSIVVSTSIYQLLTRAEKDMGFLMVLFYLICVLVEFLVYCWFGNELMLESINFQDALYAIDWEVLSPSTGKDLAMVLARSTRPIRMRCGHFIVLSLNSYIKILKVSYSVFNVLMMSSD